MSRPEAAILRGDDMLPAEDHQLDKLIRVVDPDKFSLKAHEPGFLLAYDSRDGSVTEPPGRLNRVLTAKDRFVYYFVKQLDKPLVVKDWPFRWSDGVSEVELDLGANFQIHVQDKEAAMRLVKALHRAEGPARGLHALIDKTQHEHIQKIYASLGGSGVNLLDKLSHGAGHDGRTQLDKQVGEALSDALGRSFVIGFRLQNLPEQQVQIDRHQTTFTVPDVGGERHVHTSAHLQLGNYQRYKASGLKSVDAGKAQIKRFIDEAVRNFLFGKPYYDIARDFEPKLKGEIEQYIKDQASTIGYEIKMFQTLPNIEVLCLGHAFRVDLNADKYEFRPRYSNGYVKMDVAVEIKARDYTKLARLITPGQSTEQIREQLQAQLAQICKDEINRIDRKQFNLAFDKPYDGSASVVETLKDAFTRLLDERYGLQVSIINISQAQTEEGARFESIRGKATPFQLNISAQADGGRRDRLRIDGMFEVTTIVPERWDTFEGKDFGYRRASSLWSPKALADLRETLAQRLGADKVTEQDVDRERKAVAVERELQAMAQRIAGILEEAISKLPDVANRSRDSREMTSLRQHAEALVQDKIQDEFGVIIAFREFKRGNTLSEQTQEQLLELQHSALLARAKQDVGKADELAEQAHQASLTYLGKLQERKADQLDREDSPVQREEAARLETLIQQTVGNSDWKAMPPESVQAIAHEPALGKQKKRLSLGEELSGHGALPAPNEKSQPKRLE